MFNLRRMLRRFVHGTSAGQPVGPLPLLVALLILHY
jgi:hypothetical protein